MGISIAYKGQLFDPALGPELIRDLAAKAEAAGWPFKTMAELVAEGSVSCSGLDGITLYPHPECEPLHFHFNREGAFVNHTYHSLLSDKKKASMMRKAFAESIALTQQFASPPRKKGGRRSRAAGASTDAPQVQIGLPGFRRAPGLAFFRAGARYNWTKTQFAGPKVHAAVCAILRYVKERYAPDLEVNDDSGYFQEEDYEKLESQLAYVDRLVSLTSQAIEAAAAASNGPMTLEAFVARINEELAGAKNKLH